MTTDSDLFEEEIDLPDSGAQRRYQALIGREAVKERLRKEGELMLFPERLEQWSKEFHGGLMRSAAVFAGRPPLIVFGGDVGTGKTTLAETFADDIARRVNRDAKVMRLSLRSRGSGAVGEMTQLLGRAFDSVVRRARAAKGIPFVLVVDEADAVAQSRELAQMHHEDRAGVNALIRGIDQIAAEGLPVIVVMCTNRVEALDPAIQRRAAAVIQFERPTGSEREALLRAVFEDALGSAADWATLSALTGPRDGRTYGCTFSDVTQRLVPSVVLAAYPNSPVSFDLVRRAAGDLEPTAPFKTQA